MRRHARRAHYVRPNETTRIPRRHIVFDTEARRTADPHGEVQVWRCAAATFIATEGRREPETRHGWYENPRTLWEDVSEHARPRKRTVCWAHNLAYDLRLAAAFTHLPALGWELIDVNVAQHGCWVKWRRDTATLVMIDSTAVWPCPLEDLGKDLGIPKVDLPADDATDEEWQVRCERDVAILTAAVRDYLDWIETDDLGNWQMTGAGQAWATWRHKFYTHRVLVHDDNDALAAERRAMWTGRAEVWRWGPAPPGGVYEYDLSTAYARLARDFDVPVRLVTSVGACTTERFDKLTRHYAVLADVTVTAPCPTVPCYVDGRIVWPTGTFTTTLWDCEVELARNYGATVEVHRAWTYLKAPALREWATWVLSELDPHTATLTPIRRRVVKHWSRALIGRFAMRYRRWEPWGTAPDDALALLEGTDLRTREGYQLMRAGRQILARTGMEEGEGSVPAITGYIMALARCRLWNLMAYLGERNVLYVDTDSVMVTADQRERVEAFSRTFPEWGLRVKRSWPSATFYAPRQIVLGAKPRVAGIPRSATHTGLGTFAGEVWQSLEGAMRHGQGEQVVIRNRKWHLRGTDSRRLHLLGGLTAARVVAPLEGANIELDGVEHGLGAGAAVG